MCLNATVMSRAINLQLNLVLPLVLVSAVTYVSASNQQQVPYPLPVPGQRVHVDTFPPPPMGNFSLAIGKHARGDFEGAIASYLAAIKIRDKDPAVHWYLGTAYEAIGKRTEAQREFEKEREMLGKGLPKSIKLPTRRAVQGGGSGDFGSDRLRFVPGEGMTKLGY